MAGKKSGNGYFALLFFGGIALLLGKCANGDEELGSVAPVAVQAAELSAVMYVAAASLNCRASANANSSVVSKLQLADTLLVERVEGAWTEVKTPDLATCWASTRFLSQSPPEKPAPKPLNFAPRYSEPRNRPVAVRAPNGPGAGCGPKRTCGEMNSCSEAYHYLNQCGLRRLDRDNDGIPCESIC